MKKLWLTVLEGENAFSARTIFATCDRRVIEKVATEINTRLTGRVQQFGIADKPQPPAKKPGGN